MLEITVNSKIKRMGWLFILTCLAILVITSTSVSSSNDDCFACHATENRVINQTLYNSNPHSILECIDCHVNSTAPPSTDPGHGQFIRQMNGTNITGNLSTQYYSDNFSLCYACHSESKLVGVTLPDYYNSTSMFLHVQPPISVLSIETNFINDLSIGHTFNPEHYPANIHWDHLDAFGSTNNGLLGKFSINPNEKMGSYQSCSACHNVHGTNYPKMTRNDLAMSFENDSNGTYGKINSLDFTLKGGDVYCNGGCHASTLPKYYRPQNKLFEDCLSCHTTNMTKDFNITAFSMGVHIDINTTNGTGVVDNNDCYMCHYQKNMKKSEIRTCVDCHVNATLPEAPQVTSHKPEKTNKSSCDGCHDLVKLDPGLNPDGQAYPDISSHYDQLPTVPTENYCDYCHGPNASSPFQAPNRSILSFYHNSLNASFPENTNCRTCHTRTDVIADPLAGNNSNFHNLTTEYGDVKNGTEVANCVYCHLDHNSSFVTAPSPSHTTSGMNLDSCYLCHGTKVEGTNRQKLHDVRSFVSTGCISCHELNEVNISVFGSHRNINTTGGQDNLTDDDCRTCHFGSITGDLPMVPGGAKRNNTYYCVDCHVNGSLPDAPIVTSHKPEKTNKTSCEECHDLVKLDPGLNINGQNYSKITAHYVVKPIVPTQNYCDYCHGPNASSPFDAPNRSIPSFFHNSSNASFPGNSTCRTCHTRTDVTADPLANNDSNFHDLTTEYGDVKNNSNGVVANCIYCHLDHDPQFANAPQPSHSTSGLDIGKCYLCHGSKVSGTNAQKLHDVQADVTTGCVQCHVELNEINITMFGRHINLNTTEGGQDNLTDDDCTTCHFGSLTGDLPMVPGGANRNNTYYCADCHVDGDVPAPDIRNHRPGGMTIGTTANCTVCHSNSINLYAFSLNASVSHYVTTASLPSPTVNQTPKLRFGFVSSAEASSYNLPCNNCHNPSNSSYGNATLITMPHTRTGTCNQCHVNGSASDFHNSSLGLPITFDCLTCHTTYASKYGAPDLTGTPMGRYSGCYGGSCHGNDISNRLLDTGAKHNIDRTFAGTPGSTDTVYLNSSVSLTVTKGVIVNITSKVNDTRISGGASRIGGAEYYIDADPGQGKGIPMDAVDGSYDALQATWESVKATLDTSNLSDGNHTIYVRGMDIGKQWSSPKSATLIVESEGFINGTITNGSYPIAGAVVSITGINKTITDENGNYSIRLLVGSPEVIISRQPEFYDNISMVTVSRDNVTIHNVALILKQVGTINGIVRVSES